MVAICRKEKNGNEVLEYYTCKNFSNAQKSAEKINAEKPESLWNGEKINWEVTEKFFAYEQESLSQ